jgi:hypothetical protein
VQQTRYVLVLQQRPDTATPGRAGRACEKDQGKKPADSE